MIPARVSSRIESAASVPAKPTKKSMLAKLSFFGQKMQQRPLDLEARPGLQPVSVLDLYTAEQVGEALMPSADYPSDHLAIAADFQLLWD